MKQNTEGPFKQTVSLDKCIGRLLKEELERVPLFGAAKRFSVVFLSTSAKDALRMHHHLSAAGIRAYHASDAREAELLLVTTSAKILLIDIDRTAEPWRAILQSLGESHPNVPKVVLTARNENIWTLILSHFALDVIPKPAHLGDLFGALEYAHSAQQELNDPERRHERVMRVLKANRPAAQQVTSKHLHPEIGKTTVSIRRSVWYSIRVRLSAMMN